MAALSLHNALFGPAVVNPRLSAHRSLSSWSFDHQGSAGSSVTLHQASHDLHSAEGTHSVRHDDAQAGSLSICSQPTLSNDLNPSSELHLSTMAGRRKLLEDQGNRQGLNLQRKLRRLKWASRSLLFVIVAWTVQCTVRYFIASSIYTIRNRRIILITLGVCSAIALLLTSISLLLLHYSGRSAWTVRSCLSMHHISTLLTSVSFFMVLVPAIVNFALVFVWRRTSDATSLHGRCHWDIDVAWSGKGGQCDDSASPAWGYWLLGAVVRLSVTAAVLIAHYVVSYFYRTARQPRPNRPQPTNSHPWRSTSSAPLRTSSTVARAEDATLQTNDYKAPSSWNSRSRPMLQLSTNDIPISLKAQPRIPTTFDSGESVPVVVDAGDSHTSCSPKSQEQEELTSDEDEDLTDFLNQFRSDICQSRHDVDEDGLWQSIDPEEEAMSRQRRYRVPILGRSIHRMSTIASVGSREVASVYLGERSTHTTSRPVTRSNTINASEGRSSRSASRRTSLDAGVTLSSPVSMAMSERQPNPGSEAKAHESQAPSPTSPMQGSPLSWARGLMQPPTARLSSVEELG